jgi:hypothetical protein
MTFPQVSQQDASPPIAAIYADIRRVSGLPVVNLIWRHFAALPGVLPWAWAAAAPLIGSTAMEAARTQMTTAMTLPPLVPRDRAEWHSVGIDDADLRQIISMNDAYIRGNLTNIIALTALRLRIDQPDRAPATLQAAEVTADPGPLLDPLPMIDSLDPALAKRIRELASRHADADERVIPSLYLALARWPGVIEVLPDWLAPLYDNTTQRAIRANTRRSAEAAAETVLPVSGPVPAEIVTMLPGLRQFTGQVIPDLIAVGFALRRLQPAL